MEMTRLWISVVFALVTTPSLFDCSDIHSTVILVSPGVIPVTLGIYSFDTLNITRFPVGYLFPSSARKITITVFVRSGMNSGESDVNLWIWTECSSPTVKDVRFKRVYRYNQNAYSFDSETLELNYCSSEPNLYVVTDNCSSNVRLELFAISYSII